MNWKNGLNFVIWLFCSFTKSVFSSFVLHNNQKQNTQHSLCCLAWIKLLFFFWHRIMFFWTFIYSRRQSSLYTNKYDEKKGKLNSLFDCIDTLVLFHFVKLEKGHMKAKGKSCMFADSEFVRDTAKSKKKFEFSGPQTYFGEWDFVASTWFNHSL